MGGSGKGAMDLGPYQDLMQDLTAVVEFFFRTASTFCIALHSIYGLTITGFQ